MAVRANEPDVPERSVPRALDDFRNYVRTWLEARVPRLPPPQWGSGSDALVNSSLRAGMLSERDVDEARSFQRELYDAGLAWVGGPADFGGADLGVEFVEVVSERLSEFEVPDTSCFMIGQRIVGPAIHQYGTAEQRHRWLRALYRGDAIGCQLFSEPDAGSDLASLRSRAVRDGDQWRIIGQKLWSSGAHISDVGELLVRTDPDASLRHRGLTMFLVDMHDPAIRTNPIRQMNGNEHFNEVYIDDLVVPDSAMLGQLGHGWAVANASLSSERGLSAGETNLYLRPMPRLLELVERTGTGQNVSVRQRLARIVTRDRIGSVLAIRLAGANGGLGAGAASMLKLYSAETLTQTAALALDVLGPAGVADGGGWGTFSWHELLIGVIPQHIAGGTDEIQRNILAERVLGLPRDPKPA